MCKEIMLNVNRKIIIRKMRESDHPLNRQEEKCLDYNKNMDKTISVLGKGTCREHEIPILVDLTEESKSTWKQTILKRFDDAKGSKIPESRIMIADSSSRLQRSGAGGSLATALRDRGPCVIPVQPNPSLPIRPAPPAPTRSISVVTSRNLSSPIFKLSNSIKSNVVGMQSDKSRNVSRNEVNKFPFKQDKEKNDKITLNSDVDSSNYILPNINNIVQITEEVNNVKRKNDKDRDNEYEKEINKGIKKKKKVHEMDLNYIRDYCVENTLKENSKTCSSSLNDKKEREAQHVMLGLWDDEKYSSPVTVSTTEPDKTKENCNKIVPPLRLKKIVCEGNIIDEYRNVEINIESENASNYRIVSGATPRPESFSTTSFWNSVTSEEFDVEDEAQQSLLKSDGYKIKYRRNRLRQKLQELRGKALELSREMDVCNNADTSPRRSTRLRQMMNCYEKQIENISKLLSKLSASISAIDDVVDVDYENELDKRAEMADCDTVQVNGLSRKSISLSPSPPKLSPRLPNDYERSKSPDDIRDSPPVLPKVYITIQPAVQCSKQNVDSTKSWHGDNASSNSSIENRVKVNDTDQMIVSGNIINETHTASSASSSLFKNSESNTTEWNRERILPKLLIFKKIENFKEKMSNGIKTFNENTQEQRQAMSPIILGNCQASTMNIEIDPNSIKSLRKSREHLNEARQASEIVTNEKATSKKQEVEQRTKETSPPTHSVATGTGKAMEYRTYDSEGKINNEDRSVTASTVQETSTAVGRPQIPTSNITNILQLQSNYSVAQDNALPTGVIQNSKNAQKVTPSVGQSVTLACPTMPLKLIESGSTVSSSNQQCAVLPNSCNSEISPENTNNQRNDGNRIMTEQFPTLGNWLARMSKKQAAKSKFKSQSGITLPNTSTAEVAHVSGLETSKLRTILPNNANRNNVVNVSSQWNTERWRQQHQQHQQQLYAAASSITPPIRPMICPPVPVYPPNYAIDPYGNAAYGYHPAICSYGKYSYHSRLHPTQSINGYPIPLQDPHISSLRQMQHLDNRFSHLQETNRHCAADIKYPAAVSTGSYQHPGGLDFERLRTGTATQNGIAPPCLSPLLLQSSSSLTASTQQTMERSSMPGYPASNNVCGRNRMIPDVVAAAAAAAVVAAASFGRQRPLPQYGRTDTDMVSGNISGVIDNETSHLTNRTVNREHLSERGQSVAGGINVDSHLNNSDYRQLQNLILDRLPYIKTDDAYSQSTVYGDIVQESAVSSASSSSYRSVPTSVASLSKESVTKDNRHCETPHLGIVNHTLETKNKLECSNCGLIGSMFKCLGCETAFYCDERCQTRHWSIHVEKCPKRMPKLKKL